MLEAQIRLPNVLDEDRHRVKITWMVDGRIVDCYGAVYETPEAAQAAVDQAQAALDALGIPTRMPVQA